MNDETSEKQISKEDRDLITLAVKCKFINGVQEKEVLGVLKSGLNDPGALPLINIFKGLKILSQDEVDFLLSIKEHLKNKFLDIKFGKLAVANRFTTPDIVNKTLEHQISHFKKTRKHLSVGDLLVEKGHLSETDKTAILLTQNRIKDELLEQAMYALATSELEKIAVSKRFGSIAVKNGYATLDHVNQALKIQKDEKANSRKPRYLGEILEEQFGLTHENSLKILKEQQVYEKRRLNLEKVLFKFITEVKINQKISRLFEYHVSKDKMEAYLCMTSDSFEEEIDAHSIVNWIKLMGIQFGIAKDSVIEQFLIEWTKGSRLKIAQGVAPRQGEDAGMEFFFDHHEKEIHDENEKEQRQMIRKGTVIARKTPHKEGVPGKNVFGQTILPPEVDTGELKCGKGVVSKDNLIFTAETDGYPALYKNSTLFVIPLSDYREKITILEDITHKAKIGSDRKVDLEVTGTIHKGASVVCHDLKLKGDVFGCIDAGGDLEIEGNISAVNVGKGQGESPVIRAQGSVIISRGVENAKIICGRIFQAPKGDVISSQISARQGIYCKNVYSNGSCPCVLKFGSITNHRLLEIRSAIQKRSKTLCALKRESELSELNYQMQQQIQVQDKYRERQRVLAYLTNMLGNPDLEQTDTAGSGFEFFENNSGHGIPGKTKAYTYLQKVMDQIGNQEPDVQLRTVQKLSEENHGMHMAAAQATEKLEEQFLIHLDRINKKVAADKSKIDEKEKELSALRLEQDYLSLQESVHASGKFPEIKVKNQISEGTVVLGKSAKLTLKKTIYGVRLYERIDLKTNLSTIEIAGYFE